MDWFLYDRGLRHETVNASLRYWFCPKLFLYYVFIASNFLSYSLLYKISIQISLGFVKAIRYMLTSTFMVQNLRMRN